MANKWGDTSWTTAPSTIAAPSTPALTVADDGDGSATATVADSDADTTNTIYTQTFAGELGTATWTDAGDRSGDGDVSLTTGTGHFMAYCLSADGDGNQAVSSCVYFTVTATTDSIFDRILDAVQARIQSLSLSGISATSVLIKKLLTGRMIRDLSDTSALPAIMLTPETPAFTAMAGTNVRDDMGYRILVTMIHADNQEATLEANLTRQTLWYEKIGKAFRNQQLTGVNEVTTCTLQPAGYVDASAWMENLLVSQIVLQFTSREARGI